MSNDNWIIEYEPLTHIVMGFYPPNYTGDLPTENFVKISQTERDELWEEVAQHLMCYDPLSGRFQQYVPPPLSFDELKANKKAEIASARYDYEISGIIFKNVHVTTDREDQAMITAVALSATLNSDFTTVWKGSDGYIQLNSQEILTLAYLVAEHVETAFAEEKRLVELIDSAQTEEELNTIVWSL